MTTEKIKIDPYATGQPLNEGTSSIPVNFQKSNGQPGGHLKPHDTRSTGLQELSLMNNSYFGNIHYDIHLDMKLDYTISRSFQEMSLSELETLHQLCDSTNPTITCTSSIKKNPTQDIYYQEIDQIF